MNMYEMLRKSQEEFPVETPKESLPAWNDSGMRVRKAQDEMSSAESKYKYGSQQLKSAEENLPKIKRLKEIIGRKENAELMSLLNEFSGNVVLRDILMGEDPIKAFAESPEGPGSGASYQISSLEDIKRARDILAGKEPTNISDEVGRKKVNNILKKKGYYK